MPFGDGFTLTISDVTEKKKALDREREAQAELARTNEALKDEIRRRRNLEQELSRLATRDGLTGVLNRRAVTEGLQRAMATAERYAHPCRSWRWTSTTSNASTTNTAMPAATPCSAMSPNY